jgi:virulence-associated protein VagC
MKKTKLFRSGGSYAVRIPKDWLPASREVVLRREGKRIILSGEGEDLRDLARRFAAEGRITFERPKQPATPEPKKL